LTTGHAEAWAGLQGSGGAQAFCEGCHTVNARGNASEADGGWTATADARYHDVGCESCHGPGKDHIDVPDANAGPLAQANVSLDPLIGCGQCHNGTHHPFVEEWDESPHSNVVGFAAARESCASCHRGQGTLVAWGENANYTEKFGDAMAVTCVVCHDPHGSENDANTRFSARAPDTERNLCAKCHNRRTEPDAESSHGLAPHAPQAPLLIGTAGWFPPGLEVDPDVGLAGTHGTAANQNVTGHLFLSIPCMDENGLPTNEDCDVNEEERNFTSCATAGCHGTPKAASDRLFVTAGRLSTDAGELLDLLWVVDPNLDGEGGEIDPGDGKFTTAEGAFFNVNLTQFPEREGSEEPGDNPTRDDVVSASTHNGLLMEALLLASKQAVENEYGVGAGSDADYSPQIRAIMEKVLRNGGHIAEQ
jgi:predicted CXXCH cytochrome family protein